MVRKVRLIPDWRDAWKFASVRFQAAGLFLMGAAEILGHSWNALPPMVQQLLPHASTIAMILFGLGLIGRILKKYGPEHDASK